jgi:hypothetical protein
MKAAILSLATIAATMAVTPIPVRAADAPAPAAAAGDAKAEPKPLKAPQSIYDQAFDNAYKKATEGWLEDPLKFIHGDMTVSQGDLSDMKTGKPTQKVQDQAVTRLDAVIKLLDKQCNGGAGSNPNPTKPLNKTMIAKGPGGQGDMHDPKAGDKQWASLPPKQREQILQSKTQGFPPGFESILQSYYERLAQEQVEDAAATAPAADAAKNAGPASATPAPPATPAPASSAQPAAATPGKQGTK